MRVHVYQNVTSFSHMRSALVGKRTTATDFHSQNMCNVDFHSQNMCANTLEYWSKYTNILNPTVREDRPVGLANCQICVRFKKTNFVGRLFVQSG